MFLVFQLSESKDDSYIERKLAEVKIIYEEARELSAVGKLTEALKLLKEAQAIHQTQKVQKRIDKLEVGNYFKLLLLFFVFLFIYFTLHFT